MSAAELAEWVAFERVNGPILVHERIDVAVAILGTVMARVGGDKRIQIKDLMPKWDRRPRSMEEAWSVFEAMATARR